MILGLLRANADGFFDNLIEARTAFGGRGEVGGRNAW